MIRKSLLTAACLAGLTVTAAAQDTWRLHVPVVETRPEAKIAKAFAGKLEEMTHGKVDIELYYANSLGLKDADMLRNLKAGVLESSLLYAAYLSRDAAPLSVSHVQGVVPTPQAYSKVYPVIGDMFKRTLSKWGIELVATLQGPFYDTAIYCREPVNTLEKLKSKKVRVWAKHQVESFERLGVAAQVIPQNDMYVALQTGVVDCAVYLAEIAHTVSLQEVAKYEAYLHPYIGSPLAFGVSARTWSALDDDTRAKIMKAGADEAQATLRRAIDAAADSEARVVRAAKRKEAGFEILEPFSDADRAAFSKASADAWKGLAEEAGKEGLAVRERALKALEQ